MRDHVATLMSDFYKQAHAEQYHPDMAYIYDYLTPRTSRIDGMDFLISFGEQGFVKEFLVEYFNRTFFDIPFEQAIYEHKRVIYHTMTKEHVDYTKIEELHKLGYLPIELKIIPEGTKVPIHVPMVEIHNTLPGWVWVVGFIESIMSTELWYPMCVANQAYTYRNIVNKWYGKTVENGDELAKHAISEFGFRGGKGREAGILASSAFLTSFDKTATIPALLYLEDYYNCNIEEGNVGSGMISTEHSVMCSNAAIDGDEDIFYKRLFTELYPTGNVSVVCDSYDYWRIVTEVICKKCYDDIFKRKGGAVYVRGDSGKPADIICGTLKGNDYLVVEGLKEGGIPEYFKAKAERDYPWNGASESWYNVRIGDYLYKVTCDHAWITDEDEDGYYSDEVENVSFEKVEITPEMKGTVELLWEAFGGTVNVKGYKVLDSHIRAIYGDSITPVLANEIYKRLADKGFAACNVALGAGSFSMQCTRDGDELKPFTRDTYGIAVKATYGEMNDGTPIDIFKNPKTDSGIKKSQKGMCFVHYDDNGHIVYEDGYNSKNIPSNENGNLFVTIFKDGKVMNEQSIHDIRNRLHNGEF